MSTNLSCPHRWLPLLPFFSENVRHQLPIFFKRTEYSFMSWIYCVNQGTLSAFSWIVPQSSFSFFAPQLLSIEMLFLPFLNLGTAIGIHKSWCGFLIDPGVIRPKWASLQLSHSSIVRVFFAALCLWETSVTLSISKTVQFYSLIWFCHAVAGLVALMKWDPADTC